MRKLYILPILTVAAMTGLALTHENAFDLKQKAFLATHFNGNGAPAGRTGAPGEQNCTSCHSGTTQDGNATTVITMLDGSGNAVTNYLPDSTYTINYKFNNAATKKGFELTPIGQTTSQQAGVLIALNGTQILSNGRYVTHTGASNMTTNGWNFKWKAPATNVGNVTFYSATNATNNNGSSSGDQIFLSQHNIAVNGMASLATEQSTTDFSVNFASKTNTLDLIFESKQVGKGFVNVIDMGGKSVFNNHFGEVKIGNNKQQVLLPIDIQQGIYIVHLFVNNQSTTSKIYIQK